MKPEKKHRLWTFQSVEAIEELKYNGILESSWDRYPANDYFTAAYQWMAKQMAERDISCTHAPIWAWHSCTKYKSSPTLVNARCLLSDFEIEYGIKTIEFECPADLVLLSDYGVWNYFLYDIFYCEKKEDRKEDVKIGIEEQAKLFEVSRKRFRKYDSIQACLPYLKLEWVNDIRDLNLKPNDFSYDENEVV